MTKSFSVWRGGQIVGRFDENKPVLHRGAPAGSSGVLKPVNVPTDIGTGVWQTRFPILPGSPVFESACEPVVFPLSTAKGKKRANRVVSTAPSRRVQGGAMQGIPSDRIFEVQAADGSRLGIHSFLIERYEVADGTEPPAWFADCGERGARKVWLVSFFDPAEA
jgi:hypothetical protein